MYLNQQSGTIRLDCFTHCLIVKCAPDLTVSQSQTTFRPCRPTCFGVPSFLEKKKEIYSNHAARLDFVMILWLFYVVQFIDTLLGTLVKELQNKYTPGRREEAVCVTRRFLRSVARVFVILSVEMASSKKKKYEGQIDRASVLLRI